MPSYYDANSTQYEGYGQDNQYKYDPGYLVLPTSQGEPIVVRVHGGVGVRSVTFNAMKRGTPPIIPKAGDLDEATFLGSTVSVPLPAAQQGVAGYDWSVSGRYDYVYQTASGCFPDGSVNFKTGEYPFPTRAKQFLQGAGSVIGAFVSEVIPTNTDFGTVYSWPYTTLGKQFVQDDLIDG